MAPETKKPVLFFDEDSTSIVPTQVNNTQLSYEETERHYIQPTGDNPAIINSKDVSELDNQAKTERVSTGIKGVDELTAGGFRKNTVNLVSGGPGTGKSILGMQFLVEGITKRNEAGIYITFEENPSKFIADFENFDWHIRDLIKANKLVILEYSPEQVQKLLLSGSGPVRDIIDSINAKNIVIDSLTAFALLHENELEKRKAILQLFSTLWKWKLTCLVISEHDMPLDSPGSDILEFEVDCVIRLYNTRKGDVRERALEVLKMRGTKHSSKLSPMKITPEGIVVYSEEMVF